MKKTSTLLCLLAALLIPAIAQAKPEGEGKGKKFDINGDGLISKAEVDASGKKRLIENFDKIDTNGDGNLTREEMKARREMAGKGGEGKGKGKGKLKEADTNGDGALSLNEATDAGMDRLVENFGKIDADGNGQVTKEEMKAHRKMAHESGEGKGKGKLREADTDQNGALSIDEASAAGMDKMVENFDKVDLDGDGELSREEMKQLRKQLRQKKQQGKGPRSDEA